MSYVQFQNLQGPTDPSLRHSLVEGYQPVSRIGEVVINAFGAQHAATTVTITIALHRHARSP